MKWFPIVATLLLAPCFAGAQAETTAPSPHPNSLHAGAWALQFDVNGQLISVSAFSGGVSLKRQFSPKSALRCGVYVDAQDRSRDEELMNSVDQERDENRTSFGIETVYQRYANPDAVVNAYWGLGPALTVDRSEQATSSDSTRFSSTTTRWTAGLRAALGAEWFFSRQVSLHVEYTASAYYFQESRDSEQAALGFPTRHTTSDFDGWVVSESGGVRLGLSVFFGGEGSRP